MTGRDRRALVWGGVAIAAAFVVLRGAPWALHRFERLQLAAVEHSRTLARARAVVADRSAGRDSLARVLSQIVLLAPRLVDGHSGVEAQASLSALLSLAANRHNLRVLRLDPLLDSTAGVFNRVAMHAEVEGDVAGVTRFVRALETADPLLSITSLAVSTQNAGSAQSNPEMLRGELSVTGYYLPRPR